MTPRAFVGRTEVVLIIIARFEIERVLLQSYSFTQIDRVTMRRPFATPGSAGGARDDSNRSIGCKLVVLFPCLACRTGGTNQIEWQQFRFERGGFSSSVVEVFPKSGELSAVIRCERLTLGWCPILFARRQND